MDDFRAPDIKSYKWTIVVQDEGDDRTTKEGTEFVMAK